MSNAYTEPDDLRVPAGETESVPAGETVTRERADIDGTLDVDGTLQLTGGWVVDGQRVAPAAVEAGPQSVTVAFPVGRGNIAQWRALDHAGDVETISQFGGQFRTLSRGSPSVTVEVPATARPPFPPSVTGPVADYSDEQVAPDRFQVSVTVAREAPRQPVSTAQTDSADWEFDTTRGTVGLDATQVSQTATTGSAAGRTVSLTVRVGGETAARLLDALATPGAIVEREVPDGEGFFRDTTGEQTVTIRPPAGVAFPQDDYGVVDWQLTERAHGTRRWAIDLSLALLA